MINLVLKSKIKILVFVFAFINLSIVAKSESQFYTYEVNYVGSYLMTYNDGIDCPDSYEDQKILLENYFEEAKILWNVDIYYHFIKKFDRGEDNIYYMLFIDVIPIEDEWSYYSFMETNIALRVITMNILQPEAENWKISLVRRYFNSKDPFNVAPNPISSEDMRELKWDYYGPSD